MNLHDYCVWLDTGFSTYRDAHGNQTGANYNGTYYQKPIESMREPRTPRFSR